MKDLFKSLMAEIEAIVDKAQAIENIKCRIWPLSSESKPDWYNVDDKDDLKKTMELNHYIKSYLERLI